METCGGANHWARLLMTKGFRVKLIPPKFVTPYVKSNKNEAKDAEAICEAMSRHNMRFVKAKTVECLFSLGRIPVQHHSISKEVIENLMARTALDAPSRRNEYEVQDH